MFGVPFLPVTYLTWTQHFRMSYPCRHYMTWALTHCVRLVYSAWQPMTSEWCFMVAMDVLGFQNGEEEEQVF